MTNLADLPLEAVCADHRDLAHQIEKVSQICVRPPNDCACAKCPSATFDACETSLFDVSGRMLGLMLEHFEREDELMQSLPRTPAVLRHCEAHRNAHVEFSSRYNKLVSTWHHADLASCIRAWQDFVQDWIRAHALKFDAELLSLAEGAQRA